MFFLPVRPGIGQWAACFRDAVKEGERIGRKEGERIGQKEASERYSRLILLLSKEKKDDLIIKIASDPEYREEMYKKYGI